MHALHTTKPLNRLSLAWVAALLICSAGAAHSQQPDQDAADNIVVILDASGSMAESMPGSQSRKMEVAKEALLQVVGHVPPQTNVGLLVFSGENKSADWVYPLGPLDTANLASALAPISPGGGTPLGEYIRIGADALLTQRAEQHGYGTYRLLVVTDGQAGDVNKVEAFTPDALARGIVIDVIGVAMADDHQLATRVHSYRRANDPEALQQAILASVAEIGSAKDDTTTDAENFALVAALPDGMAADLLGQLTTADNAPLQGSSAWTAGPRLTNRAYPTTGPQPTAIPPAGDNDSGPGFGWIIVTFVALAIVFKIIQAAARKASS